MAESKQRRRRKSPAPGASADLFGQVARAVNVAYYVWDVATEDVRISAAFAELFGYDPSVMNAEFYRNFFHPDDLPAYQAAIHAAFKDDAERVETTYRMRSGSGAYLWTHDQAVLERDADGRVTRVIGAVANITRDHEREAALRQALEYQTAQSDVLRIISRASFDLQPVLKTLLGSATRLCGADYAMISTRDGDGYRCVATQSGLPEFDAAYLGRLFPVDRGNLTGRTALEARAIHFEDMLEDAEITVREGTNLGGGRTALGVPLLRDGHVIGVIGLARRRVEPYTEQQIDLVRTFADQAVIAMENARLLTEQRETLERQTAAAEVLGVINSHPGDLAPVFDAVLRNAMHICGAAFGEMHAWDGERLHLAAHHGVPAAFAAYRKAHPARLDANSISGRLSRGEDVVQILDLKDSPLYRDGYPDRLALVDLGGARSAMAVALRKDGNLLGLVNIFRQEVKPFDERQVSILQNFAAQVVIAMDNARLLTEQREALERQTATAEILGVINASPGDLMPVFDAMLERAMGLCGAACGGLFTYDGQAFQTMVTRGVPPALAEFRAKHPPTTTPGHRVGQLLQTARSVQTLDVIETDAYRAGDADDRAMGDLGGARTILNVPLLKDRTVKGFISVYRTEKRAFSDKQVALLENFAAQAVIAMENARLLTEQQEALEQQTAMAEVLSVINANPGNLEPVFDAILSKAHSLCDATLGSLQIFDGEQFRAVATRGMNDAYANFLRGGYHPTDGTFLSQEKSVQIEDLVDLAAQHPDDSVLRGAVELGRIRSMVSVPLRKDGKYLGRIMACRQDVRLFTDKQIRLLESFADQAVIAMENARLLTEQQEALEQQTATAEVLSVINANPGNLEPVFNALLEKACDLCDADSGALWSVKDGMVHAPVTRAYHPAVRDYLSTPREVDPNTGIGRLMHGEQMAHIADLATGPAYLSGDPLHRLAVDVGGIHSLIAVPLKKDGVLFGAFGLTRQRIQDFSDKHIALVRNFAAQAVIAMENARLLDELRQRTEALAQRNSEFGERIEQQSATIDVLKVMSASPGDPQPVFDQIVRRAADICDNPSVVLFEYDGAFLHWRSRVGDHIFPSSAVREQFLRMYPMALHRESVACRTILDGKIVHVRDTAADMELSAAFRSLGTKSVLGVPLLRDGKPIGVIGLNSMDVGGFTDSQIALLQTFAEQAVIAITSAETYRALQDRTRDLTESLEYQTATGDVLKVISQSTFDIIPVFQSVVTTALRLCQADSATIYRYQDDEYVWAAGSALKPAYEDLERAVRVQPGQGTLVGRVALEGDVVQILDAWADPLYEAKEDARMGGVHTMLGVPLLREGKVIGVIGLGRQRIELYTERQIDLVRTFAEQAVIAITSVGTFQQLQERTDALTRSVAELQALEEVLRAVNSSLDLDTVLTTMIDRAVQLSQADEGTIYEYDEAEEIFVPKAAFGMSAARVDALRQRRVRLGETHLGRAAMQRAPVHVSDVQEDRSISGVSEILQDIHAVLAVPLLREDKVIGGLVIRRRTAGDFAPTIPTLLQTFAGQSVLAIENARLFQQLAERGEEARRAREAAETALENLRRAQDRLVQSEKMASLGQLTAGVAHEIKNPLNFVNNFSDLSIDLLDELNEAVRPEKLEIAADLRAEIDELTDMLKANLAKIAEHGRRADSIVKNMLLHARSGGGEQRPADVNALAEEALNLAYHGARAETPGFNITMEKDLDPGVGMVELLPQEITRVLVNLINNGFYAAHKRSQSAPAGFDPVLHLSTHNLGEQVEIRVRDNGTGIPLEVREKIFEPFFTTKPTGEGTGLGLSLSYDIIVKQHGGQLTVDSAPGSFTEFRISLPRHPSAATAGPGGKS